jgi:hypothetical protein
MLGACVRSDPFPVRVGAFDFVMPAYLADRWLVAVSSEVVRGVIPGLLTPDDGSLVVAAMMAGELTIQDLERAALDAIAHASGRQWWEAVRLVGWADQSTGEMYGNLILRGVHPDRVTFAAWCAAMLAFVMTGRELKDRQKIEFDLMIPPPSVADETIEWDSGVPAGFSAELPPGTA